MKKTDREKFEAAIRSKDPRDILCFGKLGEGFPRSFYRLHVRVGKVWWRCEANIRQDLGDPVRRDLRLQPDAMASGVLTNIRNLHNYEHDGSRAGLVVAMTLLQEIAAAEWVVH